MGYFCDELIKDRLDYEDNEDTCICENCLEEYSQEDMVYFDEKWFCQDCIDETTFICANCEERHWNDISYSCGSDMICESCYDYHYCTCSECGRIIHNDDACYFGYDEFSESPLCSSCYEDKESSYIHNYYYKPEPIFYRSGNSFHECYFGDGLHMGIEIEISGAGEDTSNAKQLLDIANESAEHIYIKHDGSIDSGFEIVSHPATLEYHSKAIPWEKVFSTALSMDYRSHDAECSCGLHCHVGRSAFGYTYQEQEDVIARVLYFVEKFWEEMLLFSRRTEKQLNQWAARYEKKENPKETLRYAKDSYSRYRCLNLQNKSTIEFRLFRGTLKYSTFLATLQMVNKICNVAILMRDEDFQAMTWDDFCFDIDEDEMPELVTYLKDKNIFKIKNLKESA